MMGTERSSGPPSGVRSVGTLDVAVVGAGFSGLGMAMRLRQAGVSSFRVFEKAEGLGGAWRDLIHPGARAIWPAYLFSFAQDPGSWLSKYATREEILEYLEMCAARNGLQGQIRFGFEVQSAQFDERHGVWRLSFVDGRERTARVLIDASGNRGVVPEPKIEGFGSFQGPSFPSHRWPLGLEVSGLRIGCLGVDAEAVQFLPEAAGEAKELKVFEPSPRWILPRNDRDYRPWEQRLSSLLPVLAHVYRAIHFLNLEAGFQRFQNPKRSARAERIAREYLGSQIAEPGTRRSAEPTVPLGHSQLLYSDKYLRMFEHPNVELLTDPVTQVLAGEVRTLSPDGITRSHPVDCLVYQSVRKVEGCSFRLLGKDGENLKRAWKDGPEAYLGMALPDFPNFFMLNGPGTQVDHNSIVFMLECQAHYIAQCVDRIRSKDLLFLDLKRESMTAYREGRAGSSLEGWNGTALQYWRRTRRPEFRRFREEKRGGGTGTFEPASAASWHGQQTS